MRGWLESQNIEQNSGMVGTRGGSVTEVVVDWVVKGKEEEESVVSISG